MGFRVRFWGVRGSVPSPGPSTAGVGGNTSCVEVECNEEHFILDAGTGIRELGQALLSRGSVSSTLLLSHLHWDHIQGMPFFSPLFRPDTQLRVLGNPDEGCIRTALQEQMQAPSFPVPFESLPAKLSFDTLPLGRDFRVGTVSVRAARLQHPNGVLAYRLECGSCSVVYATDIEHCENELDQELIALAREADLLIYDAMYTPDEYSGREGMSRKGWGHSTWEEATKVARAANVKQLVLFHHDPCRSDHDVSALEQIARGNFPATTAAREGLEICLECHGEREAA